MNNILLPCKKHNCLPKIRTIKLTSDDFTSIRITRQEYYCEECDSEEIKKQYQRLVDDWNLKQLPDL